MLSSSSSLFAAGTHVWVRDNGAGAERDGRAVSWWPARVMPLSEENALLLADLGDGSDCIVKLYHLPGNLWPVNSTNACNVVPLHWRPEEQTAEEREWVGAAPRNRLLDAALRAAMADRRDERGDRYQLDNDGPSVRRSRREPPGSTPSLARGVPPGQPPGAGPPGATAPATPLYTAEEMRTIVQLLGVIDSSAADSIRRAMMLEGTVVPPVPTRRAPSGRRAGPSARRLGAKPRSPAADGPRKRERVETTDDVARGRGSPVNHAWPVATTPAWGSEANEPYRSGEEREPPRPRLASPVARGGDSDADEDDGHPCGGGGAMCSAALAVLRSSVFENREVFALSPTYRFLELLGALRVESSEAFGTFRVSATHARALVADRARVLLMPLTETYCHLSGWMEPLEFEGEHVQMLLHVNGSRCAAPCNWRVPAAREATAVKTAPVLDVTEQARRSVAPPPPPEPPGFAAPGDVASELSVRVSFSGSLGPDVVLWTGIIACVVVECVSVSDVCHSILTNYAPLRPHPSSSRRGGPLAAVEPLVPPVDHDDVVSVSVKVACPVTSLLMQTPCRGAACEHAQCMELTTVVHQGCRSNVWNCPLCDAAMRPSDLRVDHRLREWILGHQASLHRVERLVVNPSTGGLQPVWRAAADPATAIAIDDEE